MCRHSTPATTEAIRQLKLELFPCLLYSPNRAPTKYYAFGALREAYHGWRSASDDEVKDTVHTWLQSWPNTLFVNGIRSLVNCYKIRVEKRGGYVQKWYTLHYSQIVVHKIINKFALLFDSASYYTDHYAVLPNISMYVQVKYFSCLFNVLK